MREYQIVIKEFPSHVISRRNKVKPSKYEKINYNKIYSGTLFHMDRSTMIEEMHKYLEPFIPYNLDLELPITVDVIMKCPINWGAVQRRNGNIIWKKPDSKYIPNWDVFNAVDIWRKVIEDVLTNHNIYPEDTVRYLRGGGGYVEFVDTFDERELIINIKSV